MEFLLFLANVAKMSMTPTFEDALNNIAPKLGGNSIKDLRRLSGGASQETWAFAIIDSSGEPQHRILRRTPGGKETETLSTAIGLRNEAKIIVSADEAGVRVPGIVYICEPEDGIGEGFIMKHVTGETIARKILRDNEFEHARPVLARQCGEALARIHEINTSPLSSGLRDSSGADQISQYEEIYRSYDVPRPIFELAIQWLRANQPGAIAPVLVHGDFRLGNLMIDKNGLAAVLDWELAHIGDPREDIGWICVNSWRFGASKNRVGGFGDLSDLLDAYKAAGGQDFSEADIDWWEILGSLKWGIMCMTMYEAFRSGADRSVERAAIGRRVSETEIDLVNLLERARTHA